MVGQLSNSEVANLVRKVVEATTKCAKCGNLHFVAEMDTFRGRLVLLGMYCSECHADILAAYLARWPGRMSRKGSGWVSRTPGPRGLSSVLAAALTAPVRCAPKAGGRRASRTKHGPAPTLRNS